MKFTTKGRYGVRLMLDLAEHDGQGPVALREVAQRQDISDKYLEHLIPALKQAGLIQSERGSRGGYYLAKPPKEINLSHVLSAVKEPLALVECTRRPSACKRSANCAARKVWVEMADRILQAFAAYNLDSMTRSRRRAGKICCAENEKSPKLPRHKHRRIANGFTKIPPSS